MNFQGVNKADILIVDDTPANLKVLTNMLQSYGYRVRPAINGHVALKAVQSSPPDLILLDVMMPGMSGYELCQHLKDDERTSAIPIIFISALDGTLDKVRAFQIGATDYITKPFQIEEVLARIENHLRLDRQRREIADLNALKDLLIRTVTHNLNTPINQILGYTDLLLDIDLEEIDPDRLSTMLRRVQTTTMHMQKLVTMLLDMSRLEEGINFNHDLISLHDLLLVKLREYEVSIEQQGVTVDFSAPESGTIIQGDPVWIREAFDNLISNAVKYTAKGGKISLVVEANHAQVLVKITDTGRGIPADDLPHLFEKFYRVADHKDVPGTGLGLSIANAIIQQHDGHISVVSEVGQGSSFVVTLPRYSPEQAEVRSEASEIGQ